MPLPFILPAALSFAGGLLKNKASSTSTTTPTYGAEYSPLLQTMRQLALARLRQPTDLSPYRSSGMQTINQAFGNARMASSNDLTARGLSTSPIAGAVDTNNQNARAASLAGFENSIPLLARQLQGEDLGLAAGVANMGRGSTTTGTESGGGGLAGGVTQLAQFLGYASGKGAFGGAGGGPVAMDGPGTGGLSGGGIDWARIFNGGGMGRTPAYWGSPAAGNPNVGPYQPLGFAGWANAG